MPSQSKKSLFYRIMAKFTAAIDPKLEKYRPPKKKEPPFTPKTEDELIGVIKRTPKTLLDAQARNLLASARNLKALLHKKKDDTLESD